MSVPFDFSRLRRLKLQTKILILSGLVFVGFALSTLVGIYVINESKIGSAHYTSIKNHQQMLERIALLKADLNEMRVHLHDLSEAANHAQRDAAVATLQSMNGGITRHFRELEQLTNREAKNPDPREQAEITEKRKTFRQTESVWQEFFQIVTSEVINPARHNGLTRLDAATHDKLEKRALDFLARINSMVRDLQQEINVKERDAAESISGRVTFSFAASLGLFAFILLTVALMTRSLTRHVLKGVSFAQSVAQGDFSQRLTVTRSDEIGDLTEAMNAMAEGLGQVVGRVSHTARDLTGLARRFADATGQVVTAAEVQSRGVEQTSSAVMEINASIRGVGESVDRLSLSASGSSSSILEMAASIEEVALNVETLSRTVEEVSSSILQMASSIKQVGGSAATLMDASTSTASSIEEMDSAIKEVERNAIETVAIADEVLRDAESGRNAVEATIDGMNEIRASSRVTASVIETLSTRVGDIGTILSVIDEVAEQTNLLALNAAIIAAQAGEHGKGFAVVADEIKDLAERTSSSTREITEVIKGVQDETQRAVEVIDQTEQRIATGELLSHKAGEALNKIVAGISRSNSQMGVIARATTEQSRGSQMIRDAMLRVSEMVAQIATATREQGRSSDQIMGAAEKMKRLTTQVRSSTREQSNAGKFIARSTEDITSMIQEIKTACDEQSHGSDQIVSAVEHMQRSANLNLKATQVLRESLGVLSNHTAALQQEMGGFRVAAAADSGGPPPVDRTPSTSLVLETAAR